MRVLEVEQGSDAWVEARRGVLTASTKGLVVQDKRKTTDTKWRMSTGEGIQTIVNTLACEVYSGKVSADAFKGTRWTDRGNEKEEKARTYLAFTYDEPVVEIGFVLSDCGRYGTSPDGFVRSLRRGVEVKCPSREKHWGYMRSPETLLKEYRHQVQSGLWNTEWKDWELLSYCPTYPAVSMIVQRDEDYIAALAEAASYVTTQVDLSVEYARTQDNLNADAEVWV